MPHPLPLVGDGEVQVVVAGVGDDFGNALQLIRHAVFPCGSVQHHVADVAFRGSHAGARRAKENFRGGADRAEALDHRQEGRLPRLRVRLDGRRQAINDLLLVLEQSNLLQRRVRVDDYYPLLQIPPDGVQDLGEEDVPRAPVLPLLLQPPGKIGGDLVDRSLQALLSMEGVAVVHNLGTRSQTVGPTDPVSDRRFHHHFRGRLCGVNLQIGHLIQVEPDPLPHIKDEALHPREGDLEVLALGKRPDEGGYPLDLRGAPGFLLDRNDLEGDAVDIHILRLGEVVVVKPS